jgi:hypothetical protein
VHLKGVKEMKEEALKLADELQKHFNCYNEYSDMIRRLVEELDKQSKPVGVYDGKSLHIYTPQTKPLSDEEIWELHQEHIDEIPCGHSMKTIGFVEFARAIEERHGIK